MSVCLLAALTVTPPVPAAEPLNPAILFCTPIGIARRPYLDLDWLQEIHELGFEPDYIDSVEEFTWDRIRQYNVLVLFEAPPEGKGIQWGKNFIGSHLFPAGVLSLDDYVGLVDRFLETGGGGVRVGVHAQRRQPGPQTDRTLGGEVAAGTPHRIG